MRIFLITPMSAEYNDITQFVIQVLEDDNHTVITPDELSSNGEIIEKTRQEIAKSDLIIAEVSDQNPRIMIELGYAQALNKPILPIVRKNGEIPFDLASVRTIFYDRKRLLDTLFHPLRTLLASIDFDLTIDNLVEQNENEKKEKKLFLLAIAMLIKNIYNVFKFI